MAQFAFKLFSQERIGGQRGNYLPDFPPVKQGNFI